jgi:hypothetical protein
MWAVKAISCFRVNLLQQHLALLAKCHQMKARLAKVDPTDRISMSIILLQSAYKRVATAWRVKVYYGPMLHENDKSMTDYEVRTFSH